MADVSTTCSEQMHVLENKIYLEDLAIVTQTEFFLKN